MSETPRIPYASSDPSDVTSDVTSDVPGVGDPPASATGSAETTGSEGADAGSVTRAVDLDATADEVWQAIVDPDERALWLDDPDAAARRVRIDESAPGERLVWTWWHPGDEGDASTVTVELSPTVGGGTRVIVTEALPAPLPVARARAAAGPDATLSALALGRVAPGWIRCGHDRWDRRLLGLELLFVAARAGVA